MVNEKGFWDYFFMIVPSLVTIIGFVVNYRITKQNIFNEISKKKASIHLDKLADVPEQIMRLVNNIGNVDIEAFNSLAYKVFSYGSLDSIKILSSMQQHNYINAGKKVDKHSRFKLMGYFILLACQIKYDITNIKVSPSYWYRLKLTDYETNLEVKRIIINATNEIIDELDLNESFRVIDDIEDVEIELQESF